MDSIKQQIAIKGMDCVDCATTLERGIRRLPGVEQCEVNYAAARMQVVGDTPPAIIHQRIRELGYEVDLTSREAITSPDTKSAVGGVHGFVDFLLARPATTAALIGSMALALGLVSWVLQFPNLISDGLLLGSLIVAGWPIARSGLRAALINRDVNINLLMTIAAVGALLIGDTAEGATAICLFAIGEALQGFTTDRARRSIRSLMTLTPNQATVLKACLDCQEHLGQDGYTGGPCPWCGVNEVNTSLADLQVGDLILVKSGARIPMDGRVRTGASSVNQAPITGESLPVVKGVGDEVYAGTINGEAVLELEVTRLAADNTLNRIIRMVEDAQARKASVQTQVDRFAKAYTPAVVGVALLLAIVPPLLFHAPLLDDGSAHGWLYRAIALLVIACPCALVISTPVSIIGGITNAARRGVLIKGGAALEALGRVKVLAFDKTGTLTQGQPKVNQAVSDECGEPGCVCESCDDLLALAASVERRAAHPMAAAIVQAAADRRVLETRPAAEQVTALTGRGVQGVVRGQTITLGNHRFFDAAYPHDAKLHQGAQIAETNGHTTVLVHDGSRVRGYITVDDPIRASSQTVVAELKKLPGVRRIVMLTGDSPETARRVAETVGIDDVEANLLPEDKLSIVRKLVASHGYVAMIGDGINDTPALAAATVGIAMGGAGTAQALETADVALMADDLTQLPFAIALSQAARRVINQNIRFSLGIKAFFLILAVFGMTALWVAVLVDMGTSLLVTFNGLRLLGFQYRG